MKSNENWPIVACGSIFHLNMLSNDQLNSHRSSQDATRKKSNWKIVILKVHFRHAKPISWQNSPRVPYQDVKMVEREKYSKWDRARNRNNWNSLTAKIVCACHWRIPMMPNCISSSLCFFFFVLRVFFIFFLDQSLCLFVRFVCDSMRSKSKEMRKKNRTNSQCREFIFVYLSTFS